MEILTINIFKLLVIFLVAYAGGLFVKYKKIRVNYTRKVNHFFLFFAPSLIDKFFMSGRPTSSFWLGEGIFFLGSFLIFINPIRKRVFFIATAFSSFDRPEDRPYTLIWYIMQEAAGYLIVIPAIAIYEKLNIAYLFSIPVLISVFGDGLAEPVGVLFGRHRYLTRAIFSKKRYLRTLEGSYMVFTASVVILCFFFKCFSFNQFILAALTIPLAATLTEAFAPHTLDNPLIILVIFINVLLIKRFF